MKKEPVVVEVPPKEEPKTEVKEKSTEQDFVNAGFTLQEIEMAKEQGAIEVPKKEGEEGKGAVQGKEVEKGKEGDKGKEDGKKESEQEIDNENLSEADIKKKMDELKNEDGSIKDKVAHGLYARMRREHKKRREAEDVIRRKGMENKYLSDNLEKLKTEREGIEQELTDLKDKESEFLTDEERAQRLDLRTKEKDLKNKEDKINSEANESKTRQEKAERANRIVQESEQEYIESHPDLNFDQCADFASEIMKSLTADTIDELIGDEMKSAYAEKLARKFVHNSILLANGEMINEDLPVLIHGLAKLHPKYKNGAELSEVKGKDLKDGKINPDTSKIDRMMKNADRNKSNTAAMGGAGGGRIKVSEDDLTWEDAIRLPKSEFDKLSDATIRRLEKESCKEA